MALSHGSIFGVLCAPDTHSEPNRCFFQEHRAGRFFDFDSLRTMNQYAQRTEVRVAISGYSMAFAAHKLPDIASIAPLHSSIRLLI